MIERAPALDRLPDARSSYRLVNEKRVPIQITARELKELEAAAIRQETAMQKAKLPPATQKKSSKKRKPSVIRLKVDVARETDGRWFADIASLPGVMTYGGSKDEAVRKVQALALRVTADMLESGELKHASISFGESPAVRRKSVPYRPLMLKQLADNAPDAAGYLAEARKDSPTIYKIALQNVSDALRCAPPKQLTVPLDPDVTEWLQSQGMRAMAPVNSILRAAMKADPQNLMATATHPKLDLSKAYRGNPAMWRRKQNTSPAAQLAVELGPDVAAWIESLGERAKTRVNSILREAMEVAGGKR